MNEMRKVQRTPGGTFFVCIPKAWAGDQGLRRGSAVCLYETSDGKLLIDPKYGVEPSPQTVILRPSPYLSREIVGKYLLGFDIIRVDAKRRISLETRNVIKKTVSRLIGLEIVEEDYSGIILQCLLDPSGFPPKKILRRSYAIAAGMHQDVVNALVAGDTHLAKTVIARDEEVNRLYFLLVRILRTIIQNPSLSEKLGVRPIECLDYRLAASMVEAIGDECVRAALKAVKLENAQLNEDLTKLLADFHTTCFGAHGDALKAFFIGDMRLAEGVRDRRGHVEKIFGGIERLARAESLDVVTHILAVSSIFRQIYEHSVDIADLVMPRIS
jgi:phosphate uptake regulator